MPSDDPLSLLDTHPDAPRIRSRKLTGSVATIVADAALLDLHEPSPLAGPALERLTELAFGASGEIAGK